MSKLLFKALLVFLILLDVAQGQVRNIIGTVKDSKDGTPLPGVSIRVKGTTNGTQTGVDGSFSISARQRQTLVFTYIGYVAQEISVGTQRTVDVALKSSDQTLNEVVVVAYGTATKQQITGSVSTVSAEDIGKRPVSSAVSALEGAAPGIQVNSTYGEPGSNPTVRIRGFSSVNGNMDPLYVVDGVVFGGNISDINPNDIESISVLKDATSAALYGSRGSSGVIIITTKRGKRKGGSLNAIINQGFYTRGIAEYSRMNPNQFMETMWTGYRNSLLTSAPGTYPTVDLANAQASRGLISDVLGLNIYNKPASSLFDANGKLVDDASILDGYRGDLDWYKDIERTGHRQDYNVSGGTSNENNKMQFSAGYLDEKGYVKSSDFKRFTGRISGDITPRKWITVGMLVAGTHQTGNNTTGDAESASSYVNPFMFARQIAPIYPVHLHDLTTGDYVLDAEGNRQYDGGQSYLRPQYNGRHMIWENELNMNRTYRNTLNGQLYTDIRFLKDFKFTVRGDLNVRNSEQQTYNNAIIGDGQGNGGRASRTLYRYKNYTFQQLLTYSKTFGDGHNIDVLAGHENYSNNYNYLYGYKTTETFAGAPELVNFTNITSLTDYQQNERIESYLSRARYNYKEKYFAEASYRMDGSSRFSPDNNNNWGSFWSVGGSWIISKEDFMSNVSGSVNYLKLRASYGGVGNDASAGRYAYQALYNIAQNANKAALYLKQNPAPNLSWEKQGAFSAAIEGRLFNRMNFSVEYFDKTSTELIFDVNLPLSAGATSTTKAESIIQQNLGKTSNSGFEINADIDILKKKEFVWNFGANATFLKNKIKGLPAQNKNGIVNGTKRLFEGHNIYDFWLYQFAGVDQMTGNSLYLPDMEKYTIDVPNATTNIPAASVVKIGDQYYTTNPTYGKRDWSGSAIPDVYGSFSTSLSWKNLSLSGLFTYAIGGKTLDYSYNGLMSMSGTPSALSTDLLKAWNGIPAGMTETSVDRIDPNGVPVVDFARSVRNNDINSTQFLHSASYLVIKNIALSYRLPKSLLSKLDVGGMTLNCAIENLATFTSLKGMNPQQSFNGINNNAFVTPRVFSLGLNIQL